MSTPSAEIVEMPFTFAELEAIAGSDPGWPSVRSAMNTEPPKDDQVALAGMASLQVRGIVRMTPDGMEMPDAILDVIHRIGNAKTIVGITATMKDNRMLPLLVCVGEGGANRVLIRIAGPGVVTVLPLASTDPAADQIISFAMRSLDKADCYVILKEVGGNPVLVRREGDGWFIGKPHEEPGKGEFIPTTRDGAIELFRSAMSL